MTPNSPLFESEIRYRGKRPSVAVKLWATEPGPSVILAAVIDTGADRCFFSRQLGEGLGLVFDGPPTENVRTGGGLVKGWPATIHLELLPIAMQLTPEAIFIDGKRDPPLLGMVGALDRIFFGLQHSVGRLWLGRDPTYS